MTELEKKIIEARIAFAGTLGFVGGCLFMTATIVALVWLGY